MDNAGKSAEPVQAGSISIDFAAQTGGTQYFVFMFGDAFATKIALALRAAGNRFAQHMIEASLMQQIFHQDILLTAPVWTDVDGNAEGW
jgi:hypothetical protein